MAKDFFEALVESAAIDFRIPESKRERFISSVRAMQEGFLQDTKIKGSPEVLDAMRKYIETAAHVGQNPEEASVARYASLTAGLCIAFSLVLANPAVRENVSFYRQQECH